MSLKHISGWVQVTSPETGGGRPDNDLPWGPGRPDNDLPWGPGRPDNELPEGGGGHVWGALIRWIMRPQIGGGPAGRPPGRPVLPPHIDNGLPPNGGRPPHAWLPGHWEPIDPGYGKPPLWGWIPGIDNGLPEPPGPPPHMDNTLPGGRPERPDNALPGGRPERPDNALPGGRPERPDNSLPGRGPGGIWVPTDPDYGIPDRCPGGRPHPPIWAWIPDRPDFPKPTPDPVATVTLYPTSGTTPAAGGTGSINVTLTTPGTWEVAAASVPEWLTVNPMGPQTADVNISYTSAKNTSGMARTATLKVNGATFTLSQSV